MLSLANITPRMGSNYYLKKDDYYSQEKGPAKPEFFGKGTTMLGIKKNFNIITFEKLLNGKNSKNEPLRFKRPKEFTKKGKGSFEYITKSFSKDLALACDDELLNIELMDIFKEYESTKHLTPIKAHELNLKLGELTLSKLEINQAEKLQSLFDKYTEMISKSSDRAGLDMTFSAPKSVSIAALVDGDKELLNAHKEAVKFSLDYVEKNFIGSRVGPRDKQEFEATKNMTAAMFHHGTSRMQDPQLHTHCVVVNTTFDSTGKWKATFNDHIYNNAMLIGTIYQKKLADLVIKLGYEIEVNDNGTFNIVGYTEEQINFFSKRSNQVKDIIEKNEMSDSAKSKNIAVLINRPQKETLSAKEQYKLWQLDAKKLNIIHPEKKPKSRYKRTNWSFANNHISESFSVWDENKLLYETLKANMDTTNIEHILNNYVNKSNVILVNSDGKKVGFTNSDIIKMEKELIALMTEDKGKCSPITTSNVLDEIAIARDFSAEQTNAFKMALTNNDSITAWHGVAGSGKSHVLKDIVSISKNENYEVVGLAPDGITAKLMNEGIGSKAQTIDSFLRRKESAKHKKQLWIIDESGKISSEKMLALFKKKKKFDDVKILLVGDTRQIGAVSAGSPFKLLLKKGMLHCELNDHRRQNNNEEYKVIVENASSSETLKKSVDLLGKDILEYKTRKARLNNVIKSFLSLNKEEREKSIIITDYHKDRIDLINTLRNSLKETGELDSKCKTISILRSRNISEEQKKYYYSYNIGEYLVPFEDIEDTNIKKGYQYKITAINKNTGTLSLDNNGFKAAIDTKRFSSFSLHVDDKLEITTGDKLEFIKTYYDKTNREEFVISNIKENKIFYANDKKVIDLEKGIPHIDYAHVKTTYSTQGQTRDRVIFLSDSSISKQNWYVALSRAKEQAIVITDDKDKLKKRFNTNSTKINALDFNEFKIMDEPEIFHKKDQENIEVSL